MKGGCMVRLGELEGTALHIKLCCWGRGGGEEKRRVAIPKYQWGRGGGLQGAVDEIKLQ